MKIQKAIQVLKDKKLDYEVLTLERKVSMYFDFLTELETAIEILEERSRVMTKEQQKKFEEATKPLVKYMAENHHPHTKLLVTSTNAEFLESQMCNPTKEFLRD